MTNLNLEQRVTRRALITANWIAQRDKSDAFDMWWETNEETYRREFHISEAVLTTDYNTWLANRWEKIHTDFESALEGGTY